MIHLKISEESLVFMESTVRETGELFKETKSIETKYEYAQISKICGRLNFIWIALCNDHRYIETARKANELMMKLCILLDSTDFDQLQENNYE